MAADQIVVPNALEGAVQYTVGKPGMRFTCKHVAVFLLPCNCTGGVADSGDARAAGIILKWPPLACWWVFLGSTGPAALLSGSQMRKNQVIGAILVIKREVMHFGYIFIKSVGMLNV